MRSTLDVHRSDAPAGGANNCQGRKDEDPWLEGTSQIGRPAELEVGVRKNIYLDVAGIAKARKLGKGNYSLGAKIALSRV